MRLTKVIYNLVINNFYIVVMLSYFLAMILNREIHILRLMWIIILPLSFYFYLKSKSIISSVIALYIVYNLLTVLNYHNNGLPISIFVNDFINSILPLCFFYLGSTNINTRSKFYERTALAIIFMLGVGLFLYLSAPQWYVTWKVESSRDIISGLTEEQFLESARFSSFLTSYYTSHLAIVLIIYAIYKISTKGLKPFYVLSILLGSISVILAQQRVSLVYGAILLVGLNFYSIFFKFKFFTVFLVSELIIIFLSGYFLIDRFGDMFFLGVNKFYSLNDVISSRSDSWIGILQNQKNYLFGHGLGTGGHEAYFFGVKFAVRDGNYFKLLYETGIVGIIILFSIFIMSVKRAIIFSKYYIKELLIIIFFLISAIGSNIFTMPYIIAIFWYSIGIIWNESNYNKIVTKKI